MDVLSEMLQSINFSGMLFTQPRLQHPWAIKEDALNGFLFHYAVQGDLVFKLAGQRKWEKLNQGDFVLILSGQANTIASSENATETHINDVLIKLQNNPHLVVGGKGAESKVLCGCYLGERKLASFFHHGSISHLIISKSEIQRLGLEFYFDELGKHFSSRISGSEVMLDSLLKIIFLKLLRYFVESKKVSGPIPGVGTSKIVSRATEALSADFQRQWSTDELAKEVGCSRNTLLSHFKKSVGMGPMEFSNYLRILRAQFILTSNPDVRVKNLAEMFGYQSDENFLFNFKKFTKMTPKDFKKSSI